MINKSTLAAVRRVVWRLLFRAGIAGDVPDDAQIDSLATLQGARVVDSQALTSLHACLSVSAQGLLIRVNPTLTRADRRYAIAHEIGHTLIDRDVPILRKRLTAKVDPPLALSDADREWLCDWIAAEILWPKPVFLASIGEADTHTLADLALSLGAPSEAAFMHIRSNALNQLTLFPRAAI